MTAEKSTANEEEETENTVPIAQSAVCSLQGLKSTASSPEVSVIRSMQNCFFN
uniref:Uncharacterized protein n=1 Tax=uncultured Verrucomicrobiales bacterium HF0200_39L05 TaxID=710997 RepID=E0XUN2_9BACT|nr:hypothetical protein [uncultured Verrucomicrobiales bacterium HF0200_39L05]